MKVSQSQQWLAFLVYWACAAVVFGVVQARWTRRKIEKGEAISGPLGQLIFVIVAAPLALAIAAAFIWTVALAVLRAL